MSGVTDLVRTLPPDEYPSGALTLADQARGMTITDRDSYAAMVELGLGVKALMDQAEAHHRPVIKATDAAHKAACAALNAIVDPLKIAKQIAGAKITAWDLEQQRVAREEQARRDRAEAERAEREAQAAALDAIDAGATIEEVEAIAVPIPMAVSAPPVQRAAGVSKPIPRYSCELTSLKELAAAVVAGTQPETYIMANLPLLNSQARNLKTLFSVPGCRLKTEYGTTFNGRK